MEENQLRRRENGDSTGGGGALGGSVGYITWCTCPCPWGNKEPSALILAADGGGGGAVVDDAAAILPWHARHTGAGRISMGASELLLEESFRGWGGGQGLGCAISLKAVLQGQGLGYAISLKVVLQG